MFPTNLALHVVLWLLLFNLNYAESRKVSKDVLPSKTGCTNCTICQYPCHPLAPPPPSSSEYPIYGAPPPSLPLAQYTPPPPSPISGYPSYGAPPSQVNCPPVPVQCCNYTPPPPPPHPFVYQPVVSYSASCPPLNFISAMGVLFFIAVLL